MGKRNKGKWKKKGFPAKKKEATTMEKGEDRLSELPDCLILYILSLIKYDDYVDTYNGKSKEVIKTCVLSKRWQFLWTNMSEIELHEGSQDMDIISSYVDYVGKVLDKISSLNNLHKFSVGLSFEERFNPNHNSWVQIAIERDVKDISVTNYTWRSSCCLPEMLYSHSSLTSLSIKSQNRFITPRETVNWQSLSNLSITNVDVHDCDMDKLLSGCPVLQVLNLKRCRGFTHLNIFSPTFIKLEIDLYDYGPAIDISAPYARELKLECDFSTRQYMLRDITSLVRASLESSLVRASLYFSRITPEYMVELLQSLQYVNELELEDGFIKTLSVLEWNGVKIPKSTRNCLTLNLDEEVSNKIPGILCILKSSPYLETLTLQGHGYYLEDIHEQGFYNDLVFDHLKTINITFIIGDQVLKLAQFLLKSANVLQKMNLSYVPNEKLTEALHALPRSSLEAIVSVKYLNTYYLSKELNDFLSKSANEEENISAEEKKRRYDEEFPIFASKNGLVT